MLRGFAVNDKHLLPSLGHPHIKCCLSFGCGCSSGVERNLAKVEVVSSNLITRSIMQSFKNEMSGIPTRVGLATPDKYKAC